MFYFLDVISFTFTNCLTDTICLHFIAIATSNSGLGFFFSSDLKISGKLNIYILFQKSCLPSLRTRSHSFLGFVAKYFVQSFSMNTNTRTNSVRLINDNKFTDQLYREIRFLYVIVRPTTPIKFQAIVKAINVSTIIHPTKPMA